MTVAVKMAADAIGERIMGWGALHYGILGITGVLVAVPVLAHKVEVVGDVAGTWHIEPDHSPRAGEPAQVWIALTRQGGAILPLEQADCSLALYDAPRASGDQPILRPTLEAISAEQYQGIPGATVTFPKTGLYQFSLDCRPKTAEDFQPFQMTYDVTVASGASVSTAVPPDLNSPVAPASPTTSPATEESPAVTNSPTPTAASSADPSTNQLALPWAIAGGVIAVPLALGIGRFLTKR